jgi:hypothetical protein
MRSLSSNALYLTSVHCYLHLNWIDCQPYCVTRLRRSVGQSRGQVAIDATLRLALSACRFAAASDR